MTGLEANRTWIVSMPGRSSPPSLMERSVCPSGSPSKRTWPSVRTAENCWTASTAWSPGTNRNGHGPRQGRSSFPTSLPTSSKSWHRHIGHRIVRSGWASRRGPWCWEP